MNNIPSPRWSSTRCVGGSIEDCGGAGTRRRGIGGLADIFDALPWLARAATFYMKLWKDSIKIINTRKGDSI